ncbi:MAG: DUF4388 domain-containing protein [Polyangiales bacterium]
MTKQNLLVVDADPRSLRVLEVSLRNAGYNVAGCPSVGRAFEILHANKPDLILSDTTFSDMNGFEFVEQLRQKPDWADIPFMFLSSDGSIESKIRGLELGIEDYLTKPIYIREVIARVGIELARQARAGLAHRSDDSRTRFSGSLSEMSVVDLLQTIDVSRKSGVLTLVAADGQEGMISFDSGAVINATVDDLVGEDAVYRHLLWREGTFDLEFRRVSLSERTVHRTTQALLMEGMRRLDEWSRLSELLPPFETVLEVDPELLRQGLRDMPDAQNEMIRLIDGQRSIQELTLAHGGDHVEALRKVVDLYFEGMVHEVGRIQDSIPVLTEVSVRPVAPPPREGVHTIPGPAGLARARVALPGAPPVPGGAVPGLLAGVTTGAASAPGISSDRMPTPVSVPAPDLTDVEDSEDGIISPSDRPTSLAPANEVPFEVGSGWQPAPAPAPAPITPRSRRNTLGGFQAARPESSMYAGKTNRNWSGRVPEIDRIDEISGRETVEVGQWDHSLEDLREDPEVEEAIVAIDSDPPPAAFVRSSPPSAPVVTQAVERGEDEHRDALVEYHEPPEVDPPPLTYAQVFNEESAEANIHAPRAVPLSAVHPDDSRPSMLPWALLILALGGGVALVAAWMSLGEPTPVAVSAPRSSSATVAATEPVAEPGPEPVAAPAPVPKPTPSPDAIYAATGAADTYEEQLQLARRLKRGSRAVAAYRRAIELRPDGSPALAELARLMLARSHTREASELAERATAVDPSNALAWVTLGAARQMRGDKQGARQAYQNCVKLGRGQYVSECRAMLR